MALVLKMGCYGFDGFNLIGVISNVEFWVEFFQFCGLVVVLVDQVIQVVFVVEVIYWVVGVVLVVILDKGFVVVGIEDYWVLVVYVFKGICIVACLFVICLKIGVVGLFGFDYG